MGEAVLLNLIDEMTGMQAPFQAERYVLCYAQPTSNTVCMNESNISAADLPDGQVCIHVEKPSENPHRAFSVLLGQSTLK
ncbi:hypothetical protein EJP77_05345 [Paenibacillus zeisoli]|uniref:Uncharacterized protein n=1 Tax=Paenibacillus zeisoli TaxID=2496267 RepID=A0A3S1BX23_9BACL|nr:hypothetical protein [Paenibacillus zeisoli]RUT36402.1 hypothetical protein EJP77_05345 [Paenibacillus zeisoli]